MRIYPRWYQLNGYKWRWEWALVWTLASALAVLLGLVVAKLA
jgi:hypothetical protein